MKVKAFVRSSLTQLLLSLALHAAAGDSAAAPGDPQAGREKAAVCAACHGIDGNSIVPQWPKLAGLSAEYIARQTAMIRDEQRQVVEMLGIVIGLSDSDIADIAAWYASQPRQPGTADPNSVTLGRTVYHFGRPEAGVPACAGCHGPYGGGNPPAGYPALAGQHAAYLQSRLERYRAGQINGGGDVHSPQMALAAKSLDNRDIAAVANYLQGLHAAEAAAR